MRLTSIVLSALLANAWLPGNAFAQAQVLTAPVKAAEAAGKGAAEALKAPATAAKAAVEGVKSAVPVEVAPRRGGLGGQSDASKPGGFDLSRESFSENLRTFRIQSLQDAERQRRINDLAERLNRPERTDVTERNRFRLELRGYASETERRQRLEEQLRRDLERRERVSQEALKREAETRRPRKK